MMKKIKGIKAIRVLWLIPIFLLSIYSVFASVAVDVIPLRSARILEKALSLPNSGTLKLQSFKNPLTQEHQKYIYLKVDDRFITELYPLLNVENIEENKNAIGAHITVIEDYESKSLPENIPEIGGTYSFTVYQTQEIKIEKDSLETDWYVIAVKSKDLETLRSSYGLSPLPKEDHSFHISFAKKIGVIQKK